MKVAGIIVEYNPMHNGHIYHLEKTRMISKADFVIGIMSGDFTQRGEPSLWDKWTRARLAVESGVDLIIELPFVFACNSAEYFAKGALNILKGLGCVDSLCFGSESGNIKELKDIAEFLLEEPITYKKELKKNLDKGMVFPKAREHAIREVFNFDAGEILNKPNNILAIEYIKACGQIKPMTIKRKGDFNKIEINEKEDISEEFPSARSIREKLYKNEEKNILKHLPEAVKEELCLERNQIGHLEDFYSILRGEILRSNKEEIGRIFSVTEGLENKIKNEIRKNNTFHDFSMALKSKRYTLTKINRMLIHILIGFEKQNIFEKSLYARILGANEKGRELLRNIKKEELSKIPIITKVNKDNIKDLMKYDIIASDIYNLVLGRDLYEYSDFTKKPYIKKEIYS